MIGVTDSFGSMSCCCHNNEGPILVCTMESTVKATTTSNNFNGKEAQENQKWFPLESNPTLMNQYVSTLGWDCSQYHIVDVYSTDDWALEMIAQPVVAVLLLYPLTAVQLQYEKIEKEQLLLKQQEQKEDTNNNVHNVWFMKQRIGNACGTIGLLHAMMNVAIAYHNENPNMPPLIQPNSWLENFMKETTTTTNTTNDSTKIITPNPDPIKIAEILENDPTIASYHDHATSSTDNATSRGAIDDDIITHFIALLRPPPMMNSSTSNKSNTCVIELDGRKPQPIVHTIPVPESSNNNSSSSLLYDACTIIREQFMKRDPDEIRFTILALSINTGDENDD